MISKAKQIERLENLIRVMRGLSRHEKARHLNMNEWAEDTDCGTTMCAAGFCASDPWFKRRGFKIKRVPGRSIYELYYKHYENWTALEVFFGFPTYMWTSKEAEKIFKYPNSVSEVITAAQARIKYLRAT